MTKSKKKKIIIPIVIIILLLVVIGVVAAYFVTGNMIFYTLDQETDTYIVSQVGGIMEEVIIPETHKGKPVTAIGAHAARDNNKLRSVVMPDTITRIDGSAFFNDPNLNSITISSGLKIISNDAFYGCDSLKEIYITDLSAWINVEINSAFPQGYNLYLNGEKIQGELVIPNGITVINPLVFYGISSITSLTIPEGVTTIERNAFKKCTSLASITLPNSLVDIGTSAFEGCSSLTEVIIPEGVKYIRSSAFSSCENLESITIPSTVESIGNSISTYSFSSKVTEIHFNGTKERWYEIGGRNATGYGTFTIYCTNGKIPE